MSLKAIKTSLGRSPDLKALLKLRLNEISATVSSLTQVANAIRSAIDTDEISPSDIRRISEMMTLSIEARAEAIRRFVQVIDSDPDTDADFRNTVRALFPANLPDDATSEQREAWIALSDELRNPQLLHDVLESGRRHRTPIDPKEYFRLIMSFRERALLLMSRDIPSNSPEASALAKEFVDASAIHYDCSAEDSDFLRFMREKCKPSGVSRHYALALKLKNIGPVGSVSPGLKWLHSAVMAYLGPALQRQDQP
ncbi:hypothetical protein GCM10019059_44830 [Camelimonas fluminis]|nr:hypothetical protein GCM10019059_44830 [Camelimonas fluminis]